jgi:hypothetical protein
MGLVATDAEGRILIPSPDGLLIRDEKGWQKIDRSVGLRGAVYAAFEDRQHSLWIGLAGRGLVEWRGVPGMGELLACKWAGKRYRVRDPAAGRRVALGRHRRRAVSRDAPAIRHLVEESCGTGWFPGA